MASAERTCLHTDNNTSRDNGPDAGQVTVNVTSNYWELHLPFGGWAGKSSGRGRVGGRHIFDAMTQIRSVAFDVGRGSQ